MLLRFCPAAFPLFPPSWLLWKHSLGSNHQAVIENQKCFEQVGIFHYECFACDVLYFTVFCYNFVSHVQWVFSIIETMYLLSSLYCFSLTFPYKDFKLVINMSLYIQKYNYIYFCAYEKLCWKLWIQVKIVDNTNTMSWKYSAQFRMTMRIKIRNFIYRKFQKQSFSQDKIGNKQQLKGEGMEILSAQDE